MDDSLMLSIYVPVYNHEKYIVQCLDSILMQKTRYKFEVLVGEDCSTDNTRKILQEYEKEHPGIFTIFYREKNMHGCKPCNNDDLKLRTRGKYIICLEGDDYWIDENKIEKQIDFLETHPEYIAVSHKCIMIDENGNRLNQEYAQCYDEEYTVNHFLCDIMPGQTTTFMIRNYVVNNVFDTSLLLDCSGPGDRRLYFSAVTHGKIYCMNETMSAYRYVQKGGSSFSANQTYDFTFLEYYNRKFLEYSRKVGDTRLVSIMEMRYLREILKGLKMKSISLVQSVHYFNEIHHVPRVMILLFRQQMNYRVLKNDYWLLRK